MDHIRSIWKQGKFKTSFTPPKVLYAFNKSDERFIVIDDHSTIFRVMNKQGQVFMVAHFRCLLDNSGKFYTCDDPMHIVSCTKYTSEIDQYAHDYILPQIK